MVFIPMPWETLRGWHEETIGVSQGMDVVEERRVVGVFRELEHHSIYYTTLWITIWVSWTQPWRDWHLVDKGLGRRLEEAMRMEEYSGRYEKQRI